MDYLEERRKLATAAMVTWIIGFGCLVIYWVAGIIFSTFMCVIRWQEYNATGTTSNAMSFNLLLLFTILLGVAFILVGFGIWYYIYKIILYNKWRQEEYENR